MLSIPTCSVQDTSYSHDLNSVLIVICLPLQLGVMHQIRRLSEADPSEIAAGSRRREAEAAGPSSSSQPGPSSGQSSPEKLDMPTAAALLGEVDKPTSPTPQM